MNPATVANEILAPDAAITVSTAAVTGAVIDVNDYDGSAQLVLIQKNVSGTTPTLDVKVQESAAIGGTYTDLVGGAFAQKTTVAGVQIIDIPDIAQTLGFLKFIYTPGGTTPVYDVTGLLVARKKYRK